MTFRMYAIAIATVLLPTNAAMSQIVIDPNAIRQDVGGDAFDLLQLTPRRTGENVVTAILPSTLSDGTSIEHVIQVVSPLLDSDHIVAADPGNDVITQLDVSDTTIRIEAVGNLWCCDEWVIFHADRLIGIDTLTIVNDDPTAWDFSAVGTAMEGGHRIRFLGMIHGDPTCETDAALALTGDLNYDGKVSFPDFLILSGNFNGEGVGYHGGDIDCSGVVDFPDFLALSANFGATDAASSVPEPTTARQFTIAIGFLGLASRRRCAPLDFL